MHFLVPFLTAIRRFRSSCISVFPCADGNSPNYKLKDLRLLPYVMVLHDQILEWSLLFLSILDSSQISDQVRVQFQLQRHVQVQVRFAQPFHLQFQVQRKLLIQMSSLEK